MSTIATARMPACTRAAESGRARAASSGAHARRARHALVNLDHALVQQRRAARSAGRTAAAGSGSRCAAHRAKPRVMTSAVRSPLRSSSALVATVVPIFTAEIAPAGIGHRPRGRAARGCPAARHRDSARFLRRASFSVLLGERDFPSLTAAASKLAESKIFIDDSPSLEILELRAKARRLKAQQDIQLVLIDYLQLLRSPSKRAKENRQLKFPKSPPG